MKKRMCFLLALCLFLCGAAAAEEKEASVLIHLPVLGEDSASPTGRVTTWSCVYFGSYPSAEVVDSTWNAVDDYALREGDLIRDDDLFVRLETAPWQDNTLEIDGASYIRVGLDRAPSSGGVREQH